jgi:hypothetical protein
MIPGLGGRLGSASAAAASDEAVLLAALLGAGTCKALYLAHAGITLNGADVSAWADQSGNALHGSQGTAARQPLFVASSVNVNNRDAIYFAGGDGADQHSITLPDLGITSEVEILAVLMNTADPAGDAVDSGLWELTASGQSDHYPFTDATMYMGAGSTTRHSVGDPLQALDVPHVLGVRSKAAEYKVDIDGNQIYTNGTNTFGMTATPSLGKHQASAWYDGLMMAVAFYSPFLTAPNRAAAIAALATYYGI